MPRLAGRVAYGSLTAYTFATNMPNSSNACGRHAAKGFPRACRLAMRQAEYHGPPVPNASTTISIRQTVGFGSQAAWFPAGNRPIIARKAKGTLRDHRNSQIGRAEERRVGKE